MSVVKLNVDISPRETFNILVKKINADLIYKEIDSIDDEREFAILVFEKYYFRSKNRAALTVVIDSFQGITLVRAIAAGSSQGMIFDFDWGAGEDFARSVKKILKKYII